MGQKIISIDREGTRPQFVHRFFANACAIALADGAAIAGSLCLANALLFWINGIPFSIKYGLLIVPLWTIVSMVARILPGWGVGVVDELRKIQSALFFMFVSLLLVSFFTQKNLTSSRIIFLSTYLFSAVSVPLFRSLMRGAIISLGSWGIPVSIYGDPESARIVVDALHAEQGLGYIPKFIFTNQLPLGHAVNGVPVLGNLRNVTHRTSVAIMALANATRHELVSTMQGPLEVYRRVIMIPDLQDAPSLWVIPRDFQGLLGLEVTKNLLNPFARILKRTIDLTLVLGTVPLWLPLMAFIYILIWLEDRKNPIFLQPRVGLNGKIFKTAKFRTMVPDAERVLEAALKNDPALRAEWEKNFKLKKDPRITKVGWFLRKTSLDEIPQLGNVLDGTMSLVGPRPLPEYHFKDLSPQVQSLRNRVRPGITGLWQVSGRSDSGNEGMEKWDPYYVRNWSIWLDVVILFRTFKAVFRASGAY
ncbi:MAG: exopolysaccharide biosynthesis polyprenyl glycosylphosphotransferase [Lentisphaerae bacterium]|nr:exopolysaccharide biosynthesis polyprenyl glycosylphosphotransferase [Lentisphaerota bacterium]